MAFKLSSKAVRRIIYVLVALVIIGFLVSRVFTSRPVNTYLTAQVVKGNVIQTVEVSGGTEPLARYELQFSQSGRLQSLKFKKGDHVKQGDELASLENSDASFQLEAQKAALKIAQANFAKTAAGPRTEESNLGRLKIDLANTDLQNTQNAKNNLLALAKKNIDLATLAQNQARENLNQALNDLNLAENSAAATGGFNEANAKVNSAQLALQQAQENYDKAVLDYNRQLTDLDAGIQKAELNVQSATEQLNLLNAPQRSTDTAPLKAQIDQAWQSVHLAEYHLDQTRLKAPVDGLIVDTRTKPGENVNPAAPLIILDTGGYVIKALVSEADIAKISLGNEVDFTFDALGSNTRFKGKVAEISPAENVVQGVVYYGVKISFETGQQNVKPGMTANLSIQTSQKTAVLKIPARGVQYEGDKAYVQVFKKDEKGNPQIEKREVRIGLQGDQDLEITSGLSENEEVVTFTKSS